jgi:hypothetical protein
VKRAELAPVLRAASDVTREVEFLVVGSAAILGSYDDRRLPETATRSREGDITPYRIQDREMIDRPRPKPTTIYAQVSFTSRPGTVARRAHARAGG